MAIVVETGSGVAGANALCSPSFAAEYQADRGILTEASVLAITSAVFAPPHGLTVPSNGANVPVGSIVQAEDASEAGNVGFGYVTAVSGDDLTVRWLDSMASETVSISLTVFAQSGWWGTRRRLEAAIINATDRIGAKGWLGVPVADEQGVPFPRENLYVISSGKYFKAGHLIPSDEVPLPVKEAVAYLSLEDLTGRLDAKVDRGKVLTRKKVGPIDKTWKNPGKTPSYGHVERLLWGLVTSASPFVPLRGLI